MPVTECDATYDVTGDKLTSFDYGFLTVTDSSRLESDISLQTGDDVGSLLLLVPTDNSVEHENTDNHTEINPLTQTSREQDSDLHY